MVSHEKLLRLMIKNAHIPYEVADRLQHYVYARRDPRDHRVLYFGKSKGARISAHTRDARADAQAERAKLRLINEIEASGHSVDLLFLRMGIDDESTAFIVEQAVIDAFAADAHPLTNLVRGHHSGPHRVRARSRLRNRARRLQDRVLVPFRTAGRGRTEPVGIHRQKRR